MFLEVTLSKAGDPELQTLAGLREDLAIKYAFCGVNERVRRKNLRQRRQWAPRSLQDRSPHHTILAAQFVSQFTHSCQSKRLRSFKTLPEKGFRLLRLKALRKMIGLLSSARACRDNNDPPPLNHIYHLCFMPDRHQRSPTGVHSNADRSSLHHRLLSGSVTSDVYLCPPDAKIEDEMDSLGLYLSIPFCKSKCTYCNFASGVFPVAYFEQYIARLEQDLSSIRNQAERWSAVLPEVTDTIYLGGGTPSLLPPHLIQRLFFAIRREFVTLPNAEITIECAPGQLDDPTLAAMVECGVNRISFGVQSFIDSEAKHTGRLHTREIALRDIERVRHSGIARVNVDLIAGLPGQTRDSWRESLAVLADTDIDHASIYMLEVDDDSRLGREVASGGLKYYAPQVPPDEAIVDMYSEAVDFLTAHGLVQYEISNFARQGRESIHNLKYWQRKPYLGLGLDAHSMLRTRSGRALRFATTDELEPFLASPRWDNPHPLSRKEELEEAWFLGLRLNEGVNLRDLHAEFGPVANSFEPILTDLECDGLITWTGSRVALTPRGRLVSNEVFEPFVCLTAA